MDVLDQTVSPMGARLLRRWTALPLKNRKAIEERHDLVDALAARPEMLQQTRDALKLAGDLERLISKVALMKANPRELQQVARALEQATQIKSLFANTDSTPLKTLAADFADCDAVISLITSYLLPEPASNLAKGNVIANGVNPELDDLRQIARSGKDYLSDLLQRETISTGISSLKIGFNNVFGYYLEVTNAHKSKVLRNGSESKPLRGQSATLLKNLRLTNKKSLVPKNVCLPSKTRFMLNCYREWPHMWGLFSKMQT